VGIMLISALLILPPVTALQMALGFRATIVVSVVAGFLSVVCGIVLAFWVNLPAGATIVCLNFLFFLAALIFRTLRRGY
jgi:zinc transport system permease protein